MPSYTLIATFLFRPCHWAHSLYKFQYNKTYLVIKCIRLRKIQYVYLYRFSLCWSLLDIFAIDAKVKPLLMTLAVTIKTHQHVILCVTDLAHEIQIPTLEIAVKQKLLSLVLLWQLLQIRISLCIFVCLFRILSSFGRRCFLLQLKVKVLIHNRAIVFNLICERIKSLLICEIIWIIKLWKGKGVGIDLDVLPILTLDRQFH